MTRKRQKKDKETLLQLEMQARIKAQLDDIVPPESIAPEQVDNLCKRGQNLMEQRKARIPRARRKFSANRVLAGVMSLVLVAGLGVYGFTHVNEQMPTESVSQTARNESRRMIDAADTSERELLTVARRYEVAPDDYTPLTAYTAALRRKIEEENKKNFFDIFNGFLNDGIDNAAPEMAEEMADVEAGTSAEDVEFTDTNNQVAGVQEGDIVKTDGKFLYVFGGGKLHVQRVEKDGGLTDCDTVKLADPGEYGQFYDLYLQENHLAAVMALSTEWQKELLAVKLYDISPAGKLISAGSYMQEGGYVSGRVADGALYLVTSSHNFSIYNEKAEENIPLVWIDGIERKVTTDELYFSGDAERNMQYTNITGYRFGDAASDVNTVSILSGYTEDIYCTKQNLYLLKNNWVSSRDGLESYNKTDICRYALKDGRIEAKAQGTVRGSTLNQFSADEYHGYFRIATTDSDENRVTILDKNLNKVSELTGLARGERIYSCKFMGEKAYLVTFRQTDPLFALDLSDVKAPKVAGELKLPGFSNYLYPFGERYLVGVGMNTDENGSVNGMRVNLFDVFDPTSPKLSDAKILAGGFHALAGITHKAFYKDPQNGVFGFPICSYDLNEFNGFVLFSEKNGKLEVKKELGYTEKATEAANNGELLWTTDDGNGLVSYNYNGFYIQRGVCVGDTLYLLSEHQLDAYDRESLVYLNSFDLD